MAGAIPLPAQERCSPLGSRLPPCSDSDHSAQELLFPPSPGAEWVGELWDMPGLFYWHFPSLPGLPGEVKLVIYSDFSHLVDELRRAYGCLWPCAILRAAGDGDEADVNLLSSIMYAGCRCILIQSFRCWIIMQWSLW